MSLEKAIQELTEAVKQNNELLQKLDGSVVVNTGPAVSDTAVEKPKEAPAKKAPVKKAEPKKATPKKEESKQADIEDVTEIDYKTQVRPLVLKHHSEKGREATEAILSSFDGAKSALDIQPEQYADLISQLEESLAEESLA